MPTATCACGAKFDNPMHLRQHVALLTPRWPAQRCTPAHYDPNHQLDLDYIAAREPTT